MGLVGRHRELAALREQLNAARDGRRGLVLVAGEPGVGKTRLAAEVTELAHRRGFHVAWARCRETEGAPSYWPWTQALRAVLEHVPDAERRQPTSELTPLLGVDVPVTTNADRFRLFDAVGQLLEAVAIRRPLLLVFDDLHRADAPSLRLLRFVATGAGPASLLLLGTLRDTELAAEHPLGDLLGEEASAARLLFLPLSGLNLEETAEFVEQTVGAPSGLDVHAVHGRTGGNPFFLSEVLRGEMRAAVPPTVHVAIRARVRGLADDTRELLLLASVLGRDLDTGLLELLAGPFPLDGEDHAGVGGRRGPDRSAP